MKLKTLLAAGAAALAVPLMAVATAAEVYPVDYWAAQETIYDVTVSPDGTRMAMMLRPALDAKPIIQVYDTADLSAEPKRYDAANLRIESYRWLSDDTIAVTLSGKVRERIEGWNQGTREFTAATLNVEKGRWKNFSDGQIISTLPGQKDKVLLQIYTGARERGDRQAQRAPNYYVVDVRRGTKKLVLKGNRDIGRVGFDDAGNPRRAQSRRVEGGTQINEFLYRKPGDGSWTKVYEQSEDSFETFFIAGYTEDPSRVYVVAHNGDDKAGLWLYNVDDKAFEELVYRRTDADVVNVVDHPDRIGHPDEVMAVAYAKEKYFLEFFDEEMAELFAVLEASIPNAHQIFFESRSEDGGATVIENSGPKDSGTFYLLRDGGLQKIGSVNPFVKGSELAEMRYVTYPARDGREIPAYVTMPTQGEAPYPTIVLPHGGPFVQEVVGYDKWSQMLANNGYLVIQPQYRGSRGYGLDHYTSAFLPNGQGGYAMQDDKDDGALYLVEQGLADRDRLAMFGWSYGGYASVVAAHRTPNIYQCAIAGASVPDTDQQLDYYRNRFGFSGSQRVEQVRMWDDSYNPIEHPEDVNIPLFLIHGSADQRTPLRGAKDYMRALDRAGKEYTFLELPGADHFFGTIGYENEKNAYTAMLDYLKDECGPGGL